VRDAGASSAAAAARPGAGGLLITALSVAVHLPLPGTPARLLSALRCGIYGGALSSPLRDRLRRRSHEGPRVRTVTKCRPRESSLAWTDGSARICDFLKINTVYCLASL